MRKLVLGISAAALIAAAVFVAAQAQDRPATPDSRVSATPLHTGHGAKLHLAVINTSDAAFRKLDTDNDGRISALEAADDTSVVTGFTIADKDRDGYLSRDEFKSMSATSTQPSDVNVSSPSGDQASDPDGDSAATEPSGDQPATPPSN